jgi:hypothetical protein
MKVPKTDKELGELMKRLACARKVVTWSTGRVPEQFWTIPRPKGSLRA